MAMYTGDYVEFLNIFGTTTKVIPCIVGMDTPPADEGVIGCLYMEVSSGVLYKRVPSATTGNPIWERIVSNSNIFHSQQTTGGNARPTIAYGSLTGYDAGSSYVQAHDLIISKDGYLYTVLQANEKNCVAQGTGTRLIPSVSHRWTGTTLTITTDGSSSSADLGGKSAYQYAKDAGYSGTEDEFAEALASFAESGASGEVAVRKYDCRYGPSGSYTDTNYMRITLPREFALFDLFAKRDYDGGGSAVGEYGVTAWRLHINGTSIEMPDVLHCVVMTQNDGSTTDTPELYVNADDERVNLYVKYTGNHEFYIDGILSPISAEFEWVESMPDDVDIVSITRYASADSVATLTNRVNALEGIETTASGIGAHAEGKYTEASGQASHAEGWRTLSEGVGSHAEGIRAQASGDASHAGGKSTKAMGDDSTAIGYWTRATESHKFVMGHVNEDKDGTLFEIGGGAVYYDDPEDIETFDESKFDKFNVFEVSHGGQTRAESFTTKSTIFNREAQTKDGVEYPRWHNGPTGNTDPIIIPGAIASGFQAVAFGGQRIDKALKGKTVEDEPQTQALGDQSFAAGAGVIVDGDWSAGFGKETKTLQKAGFASGGGTIAGCTEAQYTTFANWQRDDTNDYDASYSLSHTEGDSTKALGRCSHTEGRYGLTIGMASHAEGNETVSIGKYSHAEGHLSSTGKFTGNHKTADITIESAGTAAHAEGYKTTASGNYAHSEGNTTTASGEGSHAEGGAAVASGQYSHAEGYTTVASGSNSHAEGNQSVAIGVNSHVEGLKTTAFGITSHAEGYSSGKLPDSIDSVQGIKNHWNGASSKYSVAAGQGSHIEGLNNLASGKYSHAEGSTNHAGGDNSHVGGTNSVTNNAGSFAHGSYLTADRNSQAVFGEYNAKDTDALLIVGNGTSSARSNALVVKKDGTVYIGGVELTAIIDTKLGVIENGSY